MDWRYACCRDPDTWTWCCLCVRVVRQTVQSLGALISGQVAAAAFTGRQSVETTTCSTTSILVAENLLQVKAKNLGHCHHILPSVSRDTVDLVSYTSAS